MILIPKAKKPLSEFLQKYYALIQTNNDGEEWKPIELGDKPMYEISNHGRVRRIDTKYVINPFHSYRKDKDGNFIYSRPTYLRVQLYYYENGKRKKKHFEISRLVAIAFIPIPKRYLKEGYTAETLEVNHIRGGYEIYNNFVSNLEWCTTEENIDKAFETDLRNPNYGETHHSTYLTTDNVIDICKCIKAGLDVKKAYKKNTFNLSYKVFKYNFYNIKYKMSWRWISQYYF